MKEPSTHVLLIPKNDRASFVILGIPFPKDKLLDPQQLTLIQGDTSLSFHPEITSKWPDGSIRWLLCRIIITEDGPIRTQINSSSTASSLKENSIENPCCIQALPQTNSLKNSLPPYSLFQVSPFATDQDPANTPQLNISLSLKLENSDASAPTELQFGEINIDSVSQTASVKGEFQQNKQRLNFCGTLSFCPETREIDFEVCIHNPNAAKHPGGCWDLGDPSSVIVEKLSVTFNLDGDTAHSLNVHEDYNGEDISPSKLDSSPINVEAPFTLRQFGSGGANWENPIHWDERKQSTVRNPGFQLSTSHNSTNAAETIEGRRANPTALLQSQGNSLYIQLEDFWQNFAIAVSSDEKNLIYDLFSDRTELQGGESKTWRFKARAYPAETEQKAHSSANISSIFHPVSVCYDPDYLNSCQVFPQIKFSKAPATLTPLINQGLTGTQNFFNKCEQADVFGWRHYGELYADHETHRLSEEEKARFVSHYNNQYDPLMGMILQYIHQGDTEWLKLIHPLNQHIQDIDIYDTKEDKAEYNGGLFWHTDHYLSAETCTHRAKSGHHTAAYDNYQGGGGPGGQHGYTTGLALQYWLFGDESAKQKVAQLCNWLRVFYNGDGSILGTTFRLLTVDLKQNVLTNYGFRAPGFKYPLDRGTGNYLIALMDHYDLTENPHLLEEIAYVIRNTCHPAEDISLRNLDDFENCWFYTVFFQAVGRFLFLKESLDSIDEDYWYARHSLLHFGNWMYDNEGFYLDTPEKLEFPNDTWCAQELRKANLFYFLSYFSEKNSAKFYEKGRTYYDYVSNRLRNSSEAQYTRILALMMQNDGVQQKFREPIQSKITNQERDYGEPPAYSRTAIIIDYLRTVFKSLLHFSIKKEWRWLKFRVIK